MYHIIPMTWFTIKNKIYYGCTRQFQLLCKSYSEIINIVGIILSIAPIQRQVLYLKRRVEGMDKPILSF